jgi:protein-S-isoprenylcysteine O-methyltransferase Ste14
MAGWILYVTHLFITLRAALHSGRTLPLPQKPSIVLGSLLTLFGSRFFVAAVREFRSFEQMSGTEAGNLVKTGPYRYSRNPQIVGWGAALLGASVMGRSLKALLFTAAFFFVHRSYFVSEEQHLERIFGDEYRRYRSEVPRFLGLPENN